ncbi:dynamin family protein [Lonepinella sp. BR2919]|uniref:dynamin family protein n=1 Tax=unclassified Lonepinella TaxID=2642006 RepID=UPI003F6DE7BD
MTKSIYIEHNPFTVETEIKIDGKSVFTNQDTGKDYVQFKGKRFQQWIETFFSELKEIQSGRTDFEVEFKGVVADCNDMRKAIEVANQSGFNIQIKQIHECESSEKRLGKVQIMIEKMEKEPLLENCVNNGGFVESKNAVFDDDFHVYVAGTMSSGKSTLINALLGCELLPASNEATTATITEIIDDKSKPQGHFFAQALDSTDETNAKVLAEANNLILTDYESAEIAKKTISDWNTNPAVKKICIQGNIIGIQKRENVRLVLTDMPGPNNSEADSHGGEDHGVVTREHISDTKKNPIILYVLNANQPKTDDDASFLMQIAEIMKNGGLQSKDRFIFVLNKSDDIDTGKESVEKMIKGFKTYLSNIGVENPIVYPVSARQAEILRRKKINVNLLRTEKEGDDAENYEKRLLKNSLKNLVQYMELSPSAKSKLDSRDLSEAIYCSGVPALEVVIDDYIEKYNHPIRIQRAYKALNDIFEHGKAFNEMRKGLKDDLDKKEMDLADLRAEISKLNEKVKQSLESESFINALNSEEALPNEAIAEFNQIESYILKEVAKFGNRFTGTEEIERASARLKELDDKVSQLAIKMITDFDNKMNDCQDDMKKHLIFLYQEYVSSIFADSALINIPTLNNVEKEIQSFSKNLFDKKINFNKDKFSTEDIYKTESYSVRVKDNDISNLWGFFGLLDKYKTETRTRQVKAGERKLISLDDLWKTRQDEIRTNLRKITKKAEEKARENGQIQIDYCIGFMKEQFSEQFNKLELGLQASLKDEESLKNDAELAALNIVRIDKFKEDLDEIIHLNTVN